MGEGSRDLLRGSNTTCNTITSGLSLLYFVNNLTCSALETVHSYSFAISRIISSLVWAKITSFPFQEDKDREVSEEMSDHLTTI